MADFRLTVAYELKGEIRQRIVMISFPGGGSLNEGDCQTPGEYCEQPRVAEGMSHTREGSYKIAVHSGPKEITRFEDFSRTLFEPIPVELVTEIVQI